MGTLARKWLAGTGIRMSIGALAWGDEVTDPEDAYRSQAAWAFLFHENTEVTVNGLRTEGFRGAILLRAALGLVSGPLGGLPERLHLVPRLLATLLQQHEARG